MKLTSVDVKPSQRLYLRRPDAARYLACSVRHIDELKHDGELPFYRLARKLIVFKTDDLEALMNKRRIDVKRRP